MTHNNNNIMSDQMALGFFDADGSIMPSVHKVTNKSGNSLRFQVFYYAGQSLSKRDTIVKFAEKFGSDL